MASKDRGPYWQICMTCDQRKYAGEQVTCRCGTKMIDVLDHPDNAFQKLPLSPPAKPAPVPAK